MTTAAGFFKSDADEVFGVFYPTDYLVASFASYELAAQAQNELQQSGFKPDEILLIRGSEFVALSEKIHEDATLWSRLTAQISKIVGTEELHLENDLASARAGAAFLAVRCLSQEDGQRIHGLLKHLAPLSMRRYSPYTIDRIV